MPPRRGWGIFGLDFYKAPALSTIGLIMEETSFGLRRLTQWLALVSASYGRFINGACMPVTKLGPKFLG